MRPAIRSLRDAASSDRGAGGGETPPASTSPLPVPTQFFGLFVIQNITRPDAALFSAATLAHEVAAWSIAGLVALHAAGALKHYVVDRDDVLTRMLPRWPRP